MTVSSDWARIDTATRTVHTFDCTSTEQVRCALIPGNGSAARLDIRTWFVGDDGEWRPTRKGVRLRATLLPELQRAVEALSSAVQEGGAAVAVLQNEDA